MNQKAIDVLEYKKITELLCEETGCELSRKLAEDLTPGSDIRAIREDLRSTSEAVDLIVRKGPLPTEGIYDISRAAGLARKGGVLTPKQLLEVRFDLAAAGRTVSFMKGDLPELPVIRQMTDLLRPHEHLEKEIDRCILSEDEIADTASAELSRIRRAIVRQNEAVRSRLNRMVTSADNKSYLQDSIVTMRDGRYVIPVRAEHRARFPGIVHDQSRAGSTLFIEPQVIVDMNNELKELALKEEAEIARILKKLSDGVGECYYDLLNNQKFLVQLDFIMAKGKLSVRMKGEEPKISEDGSLQIREGRHPLLNAKTVVPITVSLGGSYQTLVITGPNTGGKTVTLKTIGLLSMMAMSGLHIPASSESRIPVYREIFADIGDEQSIEQSLSTFSSHMKNIVSILKESGEGTLVLLDELGAGTDPTEGAALAIAVLEFLLSSGAQTAATTHYNELKKYALSTENVENASMEFNVETLSPTYRLLVGTPGRSNAFEISKKLGLPGPIIDRAGELIERGDLEFEDVIRAIESDRQKAEEERESARAAAEQARAEEQRIREELSGLEAKKEKMMQDARAEARAVLKDAEDTADEVRKALKNLAKEESLGRRNKTIADGKTRLREKEKQYEERIVRQVNSEPVRADSLKVGDTVRVMTLDQKGEVLSLPDERGELNVQVGALKMKVKLEDIVLINDGSKSSRKRQKARSSYTGVLQNKSLNVRREIDVRGENYDSAAMDVSKYLDDAAIAGLEEVTIIHGRGEGILKNGIRQMLRKNVHVASFRPGRYNEGGQGVTIVKMKKN